MPAKLALVWDNVPKMWPSQELLESIVSSEPITLKTIEVWKSTGVSRHINGVRITLSNGLVSPQFTGTRELGEHNTHNLEDASKVHSITMKHASSCFEFKFKDKEDNVLLHWNGGNEDPKKVTS